MKKEVEVFEKILDKHAKNYMKRWNLNKFRNEFPSLRRVFLESMMEIYLNKPKIEYSQQNNIEILRPCLWFAKGQNNSLQQNGGILHSQIHPKSSGIQVYKDSSF
jgi:ATP-dependent exoDNAse (exonuclease V) beta subunit